jgi:hypothetical protein
MPAFIAPLDAEYISLKRAALLLAHERPGIEPAELMEMFKHALFRREFERSETGIAGIDPRDDRNYPQLRIEAPNLNPVNSRPTATPFSRPIATPLVHGIWAYPCSA